MRTISLVCGFLLSASWVWGQDWKPAPVALRTEWAAKVDPTQVLPEHPRPLLERKGWQNLNGLWQYAITKENSSPYKNYQGKILVPFPIESSLSGVGKTVAPDQVLWYHRTFEVPSEWSGKRILLHFGAVDWRATVIVNNREVGKHEGGYDPFTIDITEALTEKGPQNLDVKVWDPTDAGPQPRGKQIRNPHGIWYTSVTGIWQTVWIEAVPKISIASLDIRPDIDRKKAELTVHVRGSDTPQSVQIEVLGPDGKSVNKIQGATGKAIEIPISGPKLWSPETPNLYSLTVRLGEDSVSSYFGMRKIEMKKDRGGINRLYLNNEVVFQYGPLDQGWWPDGLYTAPTDEALKFDIEMTKKLGFNMARKHVKVEPERWYYWCDKLGLLVWQDMPSGDRYIGPNDPDIRRTPESAAQFELEWKRIIDSRRNHPCIVMWVPFNEGWGQYDTPRITDWTKNYDRSRLVNNASGWSDRKVGDVIDLHQYPGPGMFPVEANRASVLGEFGGLGLPMKEHLWLQKDNWGYRTYDNEKDLGEAYRQLIIEIPALIADGLAAAVYTQTTDVEIEVNGLMTYDRKVIKLPKEIADWHKPLYAKLLTFKTVVPTAENDTIEWKYTTEKPDGEWEKPEFDDAGWKTGPGGFGTEGTPGTVVRTTWNTPDIWMRREVELSEAEARANYLRIHHDEDAEIYINGVLVKTVRGYRVRYTNVPANESIAKALKPGKNVIAVHCHQTGGGQYIDVGLSQAE